MSEPLERLFEQVPEIVRNALKNHDPAEAESMILDYLESDDATKADIEAFLTPDNLNLVEEVYQDLLKEFDGTPTEQDLEEWMGD